MKNSLSDQLAPITKPIGKFLKRFHVIIYSIVVIGGAAMVIFLFSTLLSSLGADQQAVEGGFDKTTMEKIRAFEPSNSTGDNFTPPPSNENSFSDRR